MDGSKIITLNEVSKTEEGNYYMILLICGSLKKIKTKDTIYLQNRNRSIHIENKLTVIKGENVGQ